MYLGKPLPNDERSNGNKAAVTRCEFLALPHISKQDIVSERYQLGRKVANHLLCSSLRLRFRHVLSPLPLRPDHNLHGFALIHRSVARWNAIEIDGEIEHSRRIEPSGQHIGEQLGQICPNRCPPTSEGDMAKKEPHKIDLFDAMGHTDVADASSWTGDSNGCIHRLLRADALQ